MPNSNPSRGLFSFERISGNMGDSDNGFTVSDIRFMPKIKTAKPINTVPKVFVFSFFEMIRRSIPIKAKIGEKCAGLSS